MYLWIQELVSPGRSKRPIECSTMTPSSVKQVAHLLEELAIVADADMLEHADRNDAVVAGREMAVVLEQEPRPVGDALLAGARVRDLVLLFRQRHAGDVDIGMIGEIEREPAPARADVEQLLARRERQLGGEMPLLGELRIFERRLGQSRNRRRNIAGRCRGTANRAARRGS